MRDRQTKGRFYPRPEDPIRPWDLLWWTLGFDQLSRRRRVRQLRQEVTGWKRWCEEAEGRIAKLMPDGLPQDIDLIDD